jgi:hypothetical protein
VCDKCKQDVVYIPGSINCIVVKDSNNTVNAARYVNNILSPFFAELMEEERLYSVFQQDSTTAHMAHISLEALRELFSDLIISHGLWPPHSPDL